MATVGRHHRLLFRSCRRCTSTSRRFCTNARSVLGISPIADQIEIRRRYLELAKTTHPDVGGDAARFREIKAAYESLSNSSTDPSSTADDASDRSPPSPGAQAYRRQQAGMAQVGRAMHLATSGQRAEALEILLSVSSVLDTLPGHGQVCGRAICYRTYLRHRSARSQSHRHLCWAARVLSCGEQKAALQVFDACTAISISPFHRVEHAKLAELWRHLLEQDIVDAIACEAWRRQCMWAWRPTEAFEVQRLAEQRRHEPGFKRNVWRDVA